MNHRIRVPQVRVIGPEGDQLGVMETRDALDLARKHGLDLAEVSPTAKPPVCKIIDYGKFKYEQKKKEKVAKKNQARTELKEVQFRPQTDEHDIDFKVKHILRFLQEGNKVRVFVRFRGREMSHQELGRKLLKHVIELLGEMATVEAPPKMEGRIMALTFAPTAKAKATKPQQEPAKAPAKADGKKEAKEEKPAASSPEA